MSDIAIRIDGIGKRYRIGAKRRMYSTLRETLGEEASRRLGAVRRRLRRGATRADDGESTFWALRDVSAEIVRGSVVGLIGRNGAGKSTLLKVLSRITEPTEGRAWIRGRVGSLLEVGTGFHPELTGRENIYLSGAILGMRRDEIQKHFDDIVSFAQVEKFIDTPAKHYSSGMYLRLAFAVAAHLEPEVLLVDEVLAVGDVAFQKRCVGKMGEVARQGRTVLFVSHNMGAVRALCDQGIVLDNGRIVESGPIGGAIKKYYALASAFETEPAGVQGAAPRGTRFGRVTLSDNEDTTVMQSDGFEVTTVLHLSKEVGGFSIFCMLGDVHGRGIFDLRENSSQLGFREIVPGSYRIRVKFPALWLTPGVYALRFKAMTWGARDSSDFMSDVLHLDVMGRHTETSVDTGTVLNPEAAWAVSPASA
jgi:lipopolysaccharide transport system ATP-binding protein